MYILALVIVSVFFSSLKSAKATCAQDNDKNVCVAPEVLRTLMKIKNEKDEQIKPAFFASLKVHQFILRGLNDVVKFDDVRINTGGGYDVSTGYFTAPRKGLYKISTMIFGYEEQDLHYQLNKNNALYTFGYIDKKGHQSQTISVLVEMKRGDKVYIKHRSGATQRVYGSNSSHFSGYFIHE